MGELLGTSGLAWPRLLVYPGGVTVLLLAWLVGRWLLPDQVSANNPDGIRSRLLARRAVQG